MDIDAILLAAKGPKGDNGDPTLSADLTSTDPGKGAELVSRGSVTVSSFADIADVPASVGDRGVSVNLRAYHSNNNDGGGAFYWDSTSTDSDDGGTIVTPSGHSGPGRWVRGRRDPINPLMLGGVRDGSDITDALQSALDNAHLRGYDAVVMPRGEYGFDEITVPNGVSLIGQSMSATRLYALGGDKVAITWEGSILSGTGSLPHVSTTLRDFSLYGDSGTKQGRGIWWKHATRSLLYRVGIKNFERGIDGSGASWSSSIDGCWIVLNGVGIYVSGTDDAGVQPDEPGYDGTLSRTGLNGSTIWRNEIQANDVGIHMPFFANVGISRWIAHGLTIKNNIIEGQRRNGIIWSAHQAGLVVSENYFELNCRDATVDVQSDALDLSDDITAYNAVICQDTPTTAVGVRGAYFTRNHFTDHTIVGIPTGAVAFYQDRGNRTITYAENNGFLTGLVARQRNTDFAQATLNLINNSLGAHSLQGAYGSRVSIKGDANSVDQTPVATVTDSLGPDRQYDLQIIDRTTGAAITSTTPEADLSGLNDNTLIHNQLISSGVGYPTATGLLTTHKRTGGAWKLTYQSFISIDGVVYNRRANSSSVWSAWTTATDNGSVTLAQFSDIATIPASTGLQGVSINLASYHPNLNKGGGQFYWDNTSTDSDDGGTIVTPSGHSGPGRWVRQLDGYLTPEMYGETGIVDSGTTLPGYNNIILDYPSAENITGVDASHISGTVVIVSLAGNETLIHANAPSPGDGSFVLSSGVDLNLSPYTPVQFMVIGGNLYQI